MTHPADILRERLARTREKSNAGDNGKSAVENILKTSTPHEKIETDNSLKEAKPASTEEPKKAKPKIKPKKSEAKKPSVKKVAKKQKAKPKKVKPKKAKTAPAKTQKVKAKPKKATKPTRKKKTKDPARTLDRDRKGDGLRPIERKIIKAVANSDGNLGILDIAHDMFGPECGSEGPNSVRTIRNAIRIPIRYGIIEHSGRGRLRITEAYTKSEGDLKSIVNSYKEQARAA